MVEGVRRKNSFNRRKSEPTDISPGDKYSPLDENFKSNSTRARFEELVSTYRSADDGHGKKLAQFDKAIGKGGSLLQLLAMVKGGDLPPTSQIASAINRINFSAVRDHATTYQGKKVIDSLEGSTKAGLTAFEDINGNSSAQEIISSMNEMRKKTVDDRKEMARKAKTGTSNSKGHLGAVGKNFLVLASGIGTSSAFRKALADMTSLVSAMLHDREMSDEDALPLIDRVRSLIIEVRDDPSVRKSMSSMHSIYTSFYSRGVDTMKGARDKAEDHPAADDYKLVRQHTEKIFSRMGNGYDVGRLTAALTAIGVMLRDNENIRKVMDDAKDFGDWAMNVDEDELTTDEFKSRSKAIIREGQNVLNEEDSKQFDVLAQESKSYFNAVQNNPVLVDYKNSMVGLMRSITGSDLDPEAREEHYRALREDVLTNLPALMQTLRYVPLPRVAGQNKDLEFAADNIVLDLKHFVPEHISFDIHNEIYPRSVMLKEKDAMRSRKGYQGEQFYYLNVTGINCVAKQVAFYVKKKRGLPRIAEKGLADIIIDGRGMDIAIRARRLHSSEKPHKQATATGEDSKKKKIFSSAGSSSSSSASSNEAVARVPPNTARELDIADVKVKLHSLDMKVHENKHNICSTLGILLMRPTARNLIAKTIAKSLTDQLLSCDEVMAKYGHAAHGFVSSSASKVVNSTVSTAKKGAQKSKEKLSKSRKKAKDKKNAAKKDDDNSDTTDDDNAVDDVQDNDDTVAADTKTGASSTGNVAVSSSAPSTGNFAAPATAAETTGNFTGEKANLARRDDAPENSAGRMAAQTTKETQTAMERNRNDADVTLGGGSGGVAPLSTDDKLEQQREQRRDSLVQAAHNATANANDNIRF